MRIQAGACTLAVLLVVGLPLSAQQADQLDRLSFMVGCWELQSGGRVTHEQWMAPLGGLMPGMSRTVVGGVAREWEALRIASRDSGLVYVAQPGGGAPTEFPSTTISDTLVIFANPEHDFPSRISYRQRGADSLVARIEGERQGAVRGIDFPMRRVRCAP